MALLANRVDESHRAVGIVAATIGPTGHTLTRDIGQKYEYSNLAVGLLGNALARKAGMTYEQLLRKRILDPLDMSDTTSPSPPGNENASPPDTILISAR